MREQSCFTAKSEYRFQIYCRRVWQASLSLGFARWWFAPPTDDEVSDRSCRRNLSKAEDVRKCHRKSACPFRRSHWLESRHIGRWTDLDEVEWWVEVQSRWHSSHRLDCDAPVCACGIWTLYTNLYQNYNHTNLSLMPNSHRQARPDKTVPSVSCLPRRCELDSRRLKTVADRKYEVWTR